MSFIEIRNLRKVYRIGSEKVVALNQIELDIERGEVLCILGTSGSGKSTLLNMLAGLEKPNRGSIKIGKYDITKLSENRLATFRQKNVGFVFQSYNLLPALTALENVAMPLMFRGVGKQKRNRLALQMLSEVGLKNRARHKPTQMSGGQQQRVGIARAFVAKPKIVFADEPTGNLDTRTTMEVMNLMVNMSRENNQTFILVTHDSEISLFADRVIHIIDGNIEKDERVTDEQRAPLMAAVEQINREKAEQAAKEALEKEQRKANAAAKKGKGKPRKERPRREKGNKPEQEGNPQSGLFGWLPHRRHGQQPVAEQAGETPAAAEEPTSEPAAPEQRADEQKNDEQGAIAHE